MEEVEKLQKHFVPNEVFSYQESIEKSECEEDGAEEAWEDGEDGEEAEEQDQEDEDEDSELSDSDEQDEKELQAEIMMVQDFS